MPNMSPRHCSRSTLENCNWALKSAPAGDFASAKVPLTTPPKAWDSPTATVRLPPRRLAATAVRPSLAPATLTRAAESLRSTCMPSRPSSAIGLLSQPRSPLVSKRTVETDGVSSSPSAARVPCNLERRPGKPDVEAGPVAVQRGNEVGKADGGVDRLVMPGEASGGGEAPRDRRPGQRHFHVRERLDDLVRLVAQDDGAVLDP